MGSNKKTTPADTVKDQGAEESKAGRPTAYKAVYAKQAQKLAELGAIDREIGEFFGVSDRTIRSWKHKHPEFAEALKVGKDTPDDRVERALYQRAVGYSFDTVKIMQHDGVPVVKKYVEHIPPDVNAAQYWLNNRRGFDWKSKAEVAHDVTGKLAESLSNEALDARIQELLRKQAGA